MSLNCPRGCNHVAASIFINAAKHATDWTAYAVLGCAVRISLAV